ncbi:MAG: EamA family transporter [Solibacillus sp.]
MQLSKVQTNTYVLGVISLLLAAILTALSQVYYASKVQAVHPFLFTCVSYTIATIVFSGMAVGAKVPYKWKSTLPIIVKLNIATILAFMGFYFALKYIEPAIVSSLEMGLGPLFVLLLALQQKQRVARGQFLIALGIFVACMLLVVNVFTGNSGMQTWNLNSVIGIVASILCGLGAVYCTVYSKQLSAAGWTSAMILSKRFYGIMVLSAIMTYDLLFTYLLENLSWIVIMTLFGVLLPMYFLQQGIKHCEVFLVMMSLCFIPVFTFFFQLFDARLVWSNTTFVGVLLLLILGLLSVFVERRA